jgi:riboflavin biosynthesis pyrimidine reductase
VAADGVMAGAGTVGKSVFFSITHPELVALRRSLGLPQHPAQIVVSDHGNIDLSGRLYSQPHLRVFLLAGRSCIDNHAGAVRERPWITMVPMNGDLAGALTTLRQEHGQARISCVGGRTTATTLVDAGVVQDIYLTTSSIDGGEPGTPWYAGSSPPRVAPVVRKREDASHPIAFDHLMINGHRR